MAKLQGTILASKIVPTDSLDDYATHEDKYGRGGHRSVETLEERDNITTPRRKEGMTVYVKENKTKYILENGIENVNWKVDSSGGGSGGEVDLSDYYKKTETYSKVEVDTKISDIPETDLSNYYTKSETYSKAETDTLVDAKQDTLVSGTSIKTINGQSVLGDGDIPIEQSVDASTLTPEQMDYLRDKQIKFSTWAIEQQPLTLVANQTRLPIFYSKKIGNLNAVDKYTFLCKANTLYEIDFSIVSAMTSVGQYNFVLFNDTTNTIISESAISDYAGNNSTQFRHNKNSTFLKYGTDTLISLRPSYVSGNVQIMYESTISIKEISSFDVSLKDFSINGKKFDSNNNIDLEGLSTLSSPKLNVETLTEFRHPVSGKPIYTKTIDFGSLPNSTIKTVAHGASDVEDIQVDNSRSFVKGSSGTINQIQLSHPSNITSSWMTSVDKTNLYLTTGVDRTGFRAIITILYTKTTDTAQSPVRLVGGINPDKDIELSAGKGVIMTSANGTKYKLYIGNDGTLTTEVV